MMNRIYIVFFITLFIQQSSNSQTVLVADGPGNTYELINSVLAPGFNVIEAPGTVDNHSAFGRHIDEISDATLGDVFRFTIHITPDNDRGVTSDRQRNEIKTYDKSPDNLKGVEGETVEYKWKFKLPLGFQSSSSFTHIHQLKSVNDDHDNMPMYTFTVNSTSGGVFRVRYAETDTQTTVAEIPISDFLGNWVNVTETITYSNPGSYALVINKVSDGSNLLTYSNNNNNWRNVVTGSGLTIDDVFIRPKWGIYRKILDGSNNPIPGLKDEDVLFADFSIEELMPLSISESIVKENAIKITPNPANNNIQFIESDSNSFNKLMIYDYNGRLLLSKNKLENNTLNISSLSNGMYVIVFYKDSLKVSINKLIVN